MIFADIIIDISSEKLDRSFQYRVPEELEGDLRTGAGVIVPFGRGNRETKGYIVGFSETCDKRTKSGSRQVKKYLRDQQCGGNDRIPSDRTGCMDERELWFYHDPGVENRPSDSGEDEGKRETLPLPENFQRRSGKTSGRIGKNAV